VLVQGVASEITDPAELERAHRVPLEPWAGRDHHYLRIATQVVSGRRLLGPPGDLDRTGGVDVPASPGV
jgi:hypothetical protein